MSGRTRLLLAGTHAAAIAAGLVCGWYLGARMQAYVGMLRTMGVVGLHSLHVDLLRREGPVDAYRDALLAHVALLEELKGDRDPILTRAVLQGDTVLVLARLSRLEAEQGRTGESEAYLDRAVRACREIPWKRCDAQAILRLSEQLEKAPDDDAVPDAKGDS